MKALTKIHDIARHIVANICIIADPNPHWHKAFYTTTMKKLKTALHIDKATIHLMSELPSTPLTHHLLVIIKNFSTPQRHSSYHQYRTMIFHLRRALQSSHYTKRRKLSNAPDILLCHKICLALYTEIDLMPFCKKLITTFERAVPAPPPSHKSIPLLQSMNEGYLKIKAAPLSIKNSLFNYIKNSLSGHLSMMYDPTFQINSMQVLYDVVVYEKKVPNIRMGTPTIERLSRFQGAQVTLEFLGFLRAYSNSGKSHLYVNFQRRKSTLFSDESRRTRALESLNDLYPRTITVVTLDKDSSFYHQYGFYRSLSDIKEFHTEFYQRFVENSKGHFFFPKGLVKKGLARAFNDIFTSVHELFFDFRSELDAFERRDFIELVYLFFQDWLLEVTGADTFSMACKDGIDRAAAANSLMFFRHHSIDADDFLIRWKAVTFAPALLVKRRAILATRFDRLITVSRRLLFYKLLHG